MYLSPSSDLRRGFGNSHGHERSGGRTVNRLCLTFQRSSQGGFRGEGGRPSVDLPSLPVSPILQNRLDWFLTGWAGEVEIEFMIDTGCQVTILATSVFERWICLRCRFRRYFKIAWTIRLSLMWVRPGRSRTLRPKPLSLPRQSWTLLRSEWILMS